MMRPLYFILMLFLAACASAPAPLPQPAASHTVISSPNDDRQYRYVELPNRLKVVLIADTASDKAAAALTVFRGSAHDPKAYPGLAHFLEHMLFIGTGKYPEVDGYQQFLSAHGGSSNAYTADDHTNFFFDVAPDRFPEALDRFAQFFISPLMSAEYVDREKNAVDSEYQMQRKDDAWRSHMAGMLLMNQQHPITRFNIGNLDTLKGDVRGALLTFFESHYSSDQMALVVLAPDSLDDLEALVRERFSAIRDKQLGPDDPDVRVYDDTLLPARIDVKPVQEIREISYAFPVPALRPWYQLKPEVYIANLLGHEGEGSLFATLKALGWATGLSASSNDLDVDESEITVSIALTEEGARHLDEISGYLFAAIDLIRQEAPQAWRQHELALVGELGFRFMEKGSALRTVYALAPVLMRYPPEEMLRYRYIASGFDPALVQRYLSFLRPDNVAVEVVLPEAQTNAVEPWFNVDYALKRGPITVTPPRSQDHTALSLPPPNPFLPENLELVKGEDGLREIDDSAAVDYWLHTDTTFGVPKANIRFNLNLDGGITTPRDHAAARLYADLVADAANQWAYATLLAGMNANVSARPAGFRFDITGYADKQLELADRVVALFATLHIDPARFDILKQDLLRTLENSTDDKPYQQVMAAVGTSLHGSVWPDADVAGALKALTPEDLDAWRQQRLARWASGSGTRQCRAVQGRCHPGCRGKAPARRQGEQRTAGACGAASCRIHRTADRSRRRGHCRLYPGTGPALANTRAQRSGRAPHAAGLLHEPAHGTAAWLRGGYGSADHRPAAGTADARAVALRRPRRHREGHRYVSRRPGRGDPRPVRSAFRRQPRRLAGEAARGGQESGRAHGTLLERSGRGHHHLRFTAAARRCHSRPDPGRRGGLGRRAAPALQGGKPHRLGARQTRSPAAARTGVQGCRGLQAASNSR
ncbi:MAG: insulinase family protein [Pseudomonadales bacterium]